MITRTADLTRVNGRLVPVACRDCGGHDAYESSRSNQLSVTFASSATGGTMGAQLRRRLRQLLRCHYRLCPLCAIERPSRPPITSGQAASESGLDAMRWTTSRVSATRELITSFRKIWRSWKSIVCLRGAAEPPPHDWWRPRR